MSETYQAQGRPVYSMRLGSTERLLIAAAAAARKEPLSTFIREQALDAARQILGLEPKGGEGIVNSETAGAVGP